MTNKKGRYAAQDAQNEVLLGHRTVLRSFKLCLLLHRTLPTAAAWWTFHGISLGPLLLRAALLFCAGLLLGKLSIKAIWHLVGPSPLYLVKIAGGWPQDKKADPLLAVRRKGPCFNAIPSLSGRVAAKRCLLHWKNGAHSELDHFHWHGLRS